MDYTYVYTDIYIISNTLNNYIVFHLTYWNEPIDKAWET